MTKLSAFEKTINDYLHYGYLPPDKLPHFLLHFDENYPREYSVNSASSLLDKIFDDSLKDFSGTNHCIVPVSGGWDSRLLLGLALERFPSRQIRAFTFGTEGQLDYEVGRLIARKSGVEHVNIDLGTIELSWETLEESVNESPWTYVPDSFFNKLCYKKMAGGNDIILSGFMGDPLTGGHMHKANGSGILDYFAKEQSVLKSREITYPGYDPVRSLPALPQKSELSWHELLDLGVRQAYCITPIISSKQVWDTWSTTLGKIRGTNTELITPFAHQEWIRYWVHAPAYLKKNRKLYLEVIREKFPQLAKMPVKDFYGAQKPSGLNFHLKKKMYHGQLLLNRNLPGVFRQPLHMMNYLDYAKAFRTRDDYREVLNRAVAFLKEHEVTPWIPFLKFQNEHDSKLADHSKLFLLLIGLALNISANPQIRNFENEE